MDAQGGLVGIILGGNSGGAALAVPVDSVIGLVDGGLNTPFGEGTALQFPSNQPAPASRAVANADPKQLLRDAKTALIYSRTNFFTPDALAREWIKDSGFQSLGLALVKDERLADLEIKIDRPLFTYTFTYSITDKRTSRLLDSGKVTAIDGNAAAGKLAKAILKRLQDARAEPSKKP
ncbi:MAG: hypothetical protein INH40_07990 [Acidobacteriaceae bacterium]|nr:hypothetical protein [Acidobacteriaceae bacterium]